MELSRWRKAGTRLVAVAIAGVRGQRLLGHAQARERARRAAATARRRQARRVISPSTSATSSISRPTAPTCRPRPADPDEPGALAAAVFAVHHHHRGPRRRARHARVQHRARRQARHRRCATSWPSTASTPSASAPSPTARSGRSRSATTSPAGRRTAARRPCSTAATRRVPRHVRARFVRPSPVPPISARDGAALRGACCLLMHRRRSVRQPKFGPNAGALSPLTRRWRAGNVALKCPAGATRAFCGLPLWRCVQPVPATLASTAMPRAHAAWTPASAAVEFQTQVGDRVFFSEGSAELGSRARAALEAQAAWLKRHSTLAVMVEGHADDAGVAAHNLEVSRRRAEAVRRRLIESGVAPERILVRRLRSRSPDRRMRRARVARRRTGASSPSSACPMPPRHQSPSQSWSRTIPRPGGRRADFIEVCALPTLQCRGQECRGVSGQARGHLRVGAGRAATGNADSRMITIAQRWLRVGGFTLLALCGSPALAQQPRRGRRRRRPPPPARRRRARPPPPRHLPLETRLPCASASSSSRSSSSICRWWWVRSSRWRAARPHRRPGPGVPRLDLRLPLAPPMPAASTASRRRSERSPPSSSRCRSRCARCPRQVPDRPRPPPSRRLPPRARVPAGRVRMPILPPSPSARASAP